MGAVPRAALAEPSCAQVLAVRGCLGWDLTVLSNMSVSVQNTYVWELSHNLPWLDPAMAEELRNNIEALRLLEQEHAQVCKWSWLITQQSFSPTSKTALELAMHVCYAWCYWTHSSASMREGDDIAVQDCLPAAGAPVKTSAIAVTQQCHF